MWEAGEGPKEGPGLQPRSISCASSRSSPRRCHPFPLSPSPTVSLLPPPSPPSLTTLLTSPPLRPRQLGGGSDEGGADKAEERIHKVGGREEGEGATAPALTRRGRVGGQCVHS